MFHKSLLIITKQNKKITIEILFQTTW